MCGRDPRVTVSRLAVQQRPHCCPVAWPRTGPVRWNTPALSTREHVRTMNPYSAVFDGSSTRRRNILSAISPGPTSRALSSSIAYPGWRPRIRPGSSRQLPTISRQPGRNTTSRPPRQSQKPSSRRASFRRGWNLLRLPRQVGGGFPSRYRHQPYLPLATDEKVETFNAVWYDYQDSPSRCAREGLQQPTVSAGRPSGALVPLRSVSLAERLKPRGGQF
jgi:hypothetical protein